MPEDANLLRDVAAFGLGKFLIGQVERQLNVLGYFREETLQLATFEATNGTNLAEIGVAAAGEFDQKVVAKDESRWSIAVLRFGFANATAREPRRVRGDSDRRGQKCDASVRGCGWR